MLAFFTSINYQFENIQRPLKKKQTKWIEMNPLQAKKMAF